MGAFNMDMPGNFMKLLEELENTDSLCEEGMREAEKIVEEAMKQECEKHHRAERDPTRGEMEASIKPTGPKKNEYGLFDFVRPTGRDSKGVRNMEKFAYLQYGTAKQVATPICEPVISGVEEKVRGKLQEPFTKAVERNGG